MSNQALPVRLYGEGPNPPQSTWHPNRRDENQTQNRQYFILFRDHILSFYSIPPEFLNQFGRTTTLENQPPKK